MDVQRYLFNILNEKLLNGEQFKFGEGAFVIILSLNKNEGRYSEN